LETKRVTGIETDGNPTDVTVVTETRAKDVEVKRSQVELNKELGYSRNVVEIAATQTTKTILGTENGTGAVVRRLTETTERDGMTTHGDFHERHTVSGS
jgi:hypothetical protein